MHRRKLLIRSASIGAYFVLSFVMLNWFGGHGCLSSALKLSLGCTGWDLFAFAVGSWIAQRLMKLRTAAPLLAAAITGGGLASVPFWIYRGYGHFFFEGTWADISCFFSEGAAIAFAFVIAPALGILSLIHAVFWLRTE